MTRTHGLYEYVVQLTVSQTDIWTPANLPSIWCQFVGFWTSGPVQTDLVTRVGWLEVSGLSGPDNLVTRVGVALRA